MLKIGLTASDAKLVQDRRLSNKDTSIQKYCEQVLDASLLNPLETLAWLAESVRRNLQDIEDYTPDIDTQLNDPFHLPPVIPPLSMTAEEAEAAGNISYPNGDVIRSQIIGQ